MSKRINGISIIAVEHPQQCDMCGGIAELRPYGPRGEAICYDCGMKDVETTERMCRIVLFGMKE